MIDPRARMLCRQLNILLFLKRQGPARMREIAAALHVTERTVRRDLDALRSIFPEAVTRVETEADPIIRWRFRGLPELAP